MITLVFNITALSLKTFILTQINMFIWIYNKKKLIIVKRAMKDAICPFLVTKSINFSLNLVFPNKLLLIRINRAYNDLSAFKKGLL